MKVREVRCVFFFSSLVAYANVGFSGFLLVRPFLSLFILWHRTTMTSVQRWQLAAPLVRLGAKRRMDLVTA